MSRVNRATLKDHFKTNSIPTSKHFGDLIDSALGPDDGIDKSAEGALRIAASSVGKRAVEFYETVAGLADTTQPAWVLSLESNQGAAFSLRDGNGTSWLTIEQNTEMVRVRGAIEAGAGIRGSDGSSLRVLGGLEVQADVETSGTMTIGGELVAKKGAAVTGGALHVGTSSETQPLEVHGTLTANGLVKANQGMTVDGPLSAMRGTTVTGGPLVVGTTESSQSVEIFGPHVVNGLIEARQGMTVGGGVLTVNQGVAITGGALNVGSVDLDIPLNAWGTLTANRLIEARQGVNVTGALTLNSGLTVVGNALNVGTAEAPQPLNAFGAVTVGTTAVPQAMRVTGTVTAEKGIRLAAEEALATSRSGVLFDRNTTSAGVRLPDISNTVDFTNGLMIQAWVYLFEYAPNARIVDIGGTDAFFFGLGSVSGNNLQIWVKNGSQSYAVSSTGNIPLPLNVWAHVAVHITRSTGTRLYINGIYAGSSGGGLYPNNCGRYKNNVGRDPLGTNCLKGLVSELSLWAGANIPLPSTTSPASNATGLIGYWKFDGQAGSVAKETSGKMPSAILENGAIFGRAPLRLGVVPNVAGLPDNERTPLPAQPVDISGILTLQRGICSADGQALAVRSPLSVTGLVTANAGLNVTGNAVVNGTVEARGAVTIGTNAMPTPPELTSWGRINANDGILVPAQKTLKVDGRLVVALPNWMNLALMEGWEPVDGPAQTPPGYYVDSLERVQLRGAIRGTETSGQKLFELSRLIAPAGVMQFSAYSEDATGTPRAAGIVVTPGGGTDGDVLVTVKGGDKNLICLDGISFRTANPVA